MHCNVQTLSFLCAEQHILLSRFDCLLCHVKLWHGYVAAIVLFVIELNLL
jgi:hypothetical protein